MLGGQPYDAVRERAPRPRVQGDDGPELSAHHVHEWACPDDVFGTAVLRQQPIKPVEGGRVHAGTGLDRAGHTGQQVLVRSWPGEREGGHGRVRLTRRRYAEVMCGRSEPRHDALPHLDRGHAPPPPLDVGDIGLSETDPLAELRLTQSGELPVGAEDLAPVLTGERRGQPRVGPQIEAGFPHSSNIGHRYRAMGWERRPCHARVFTQGPATG